MCIAKFLNKLIKHKTQFEQNKHNCNYYNKGVDINNFKQVN